MSLSDRLTSGSVSDRATALQFSAARARNDSRRAAEKKAAREREIEKTKRMFEGRVPSDMSQVHKQMSNIKTIEL